MLVASFMMFNDFFKLEAILNIIFIMALGDCLAFT